MSKSPITCHVLDSSVGKPAADVSVQLHGWDAQGNFKPLATGVTNADGRCLDLLPPRELQKANLHAGIYKIVFQTKPYFEQKAIKTFYPFVEITFQLENPEEHYHIPLLISPYSYTTYRGS